MKFEDLTVIKSLQGQQFNVHLCDLNIVIIVTNKNSSIDVVDIKEMLTLISQFDLAGKSKLLSIAGPFSELTSEAQKFMRTEDANVNRHLCEAIVVSSLAQRIIGNVYLKIVSSKRPSKLFTSLPKAIEWLNTTGKKS